MFEHKLDYVEWLTQHFYALVHRFGLNLPEKPMDHVWMALFVVLFCALFFGYWKKKYKVYPGFTQQVIETYFRFIENLVKDMIGPKGKQFIPVIGTLGVFILLSNLMGLIPIFKSPTSNVNVTFACAVFIFIYYHATGIRHQGLLNYIKHFAGPVWWLAPLFFPVEIIGHFSRPLSLTIRLFGNIFGEDTIIAILTMLVPFGLLVPLPMMCLAIFTSLIQTLVFIMLSSVYIAGAIAHEESHEEHPEEESAVGHLAPAH
jgi:F-type H+-transporting ATPase subunit a